MGKVRGCIQNFGGEIMRIVVAWKSEKHVRVAGGWNWLRIVSSGRLWY
jgi:hypothetical protein